MGMKRVVGPNYGVFRSLPSATVHQMLVPVTTTAYRLSLLLFLCALTDILHDWSFWVCLSLALWVLANVWRRAVPVLWAEQGKLSYQPVAENGVAGGRQSPLSTARSETAVGEDVAPRRIRTLQWWSRLSQTLWDVALLLLASFSVLLRHSRGAAVAFSWLIPQVPSPTRERRARSSISCSGRFPC